MRAGGLKNAIGLKFGVLLLFLASVSPVRADWLQQAKLVASDGVAADMFGASVSVSGNYCVIGASLNDGDGNNGGAAYIFKFDGTSWMEQAKLIASDAAADDEFGFSVAISGDYCLVGARFDDDNGDRSGSAYIFKRDGENWIQQAKLLASDGVGDARFGASVSLSGDYAVVGARYDDANGRNSGSAYIFTRESTSWVQQAKLLPLDGAANDLFGFSVCISGDYCLVGAWGNDDNGDSSGSAYIFRRDGTSWVQQAKLLASDGTAGDRFGFSVSVSDDYCLIGASLNDDKGVSSGSAYVFKRDGENWIQQAKLLASDGSEYDYFGYSVATGETYCMVGADGDNGNAGSAYIFERDGENWTQQTKLTAPDRTAYDYFGWAVAVSGPYCLVGVSGDDDNGSASGSAYVFIEPGTLVGLEITGSQEVLEYSLAQYEAIAYYDNACTENVTTLATWSVEPNTYASIDANGLLTTGNNPADICIYAQYAGFEAELSVRIYSIPNAVYVPGQYETIQAAIDAAEDGNVVIVAAGIYTGDGNRDIDFAGKAITLRSTSGPGNCIIDCGGFSSHRGFYFHSGETAESVVRGFTIKRGRIYGQGAKGGGIYCSGSSPTIENCIITDNRAYSSTGGGHACGGGVYSDSNSNPTIESCSIEGNKALGGNGTSDMGYAGGGYPGYGAGIFCGADGRVTINNCTINNNEAAGGDGGWSMTWGGDGGNAYGGGVYLGSKNESIISNCTVTDNKVLCGDGYDTMAYDGIDGTASGAGICCGIDGTAIVNNCLISNNEAIGGDITCIASWCGGGNPYGGGLCLNSNNESTIGNCTITGNSVSCGDADAFGAGVYCASDSTAIIENCIIWDNNGADEIYGSQYGSQVDITYSDIKNGYAGVGNIDADPLFVTGPLGDYYLTQTAAGQAENSLCVDTGGNAASVLGMDIFTTRTDEVGDEGIVDMGYHYSMPVLNPADIDDDGDVDFEDFAVLASRWQLVPGIPSADIAPLGGDGIIDIYDLALLAENWLYSVTVLNPADIDVDGDVDFADFAALASRWQRVPGIPSADIAPVGGDGIIDINDLALLAENWLWKE